MRLNSVERVALAYFLSGPKPWDGKRADTVPTTRAVLAHRLSLGLVRSQIGETLPLGVQDGTQLWITPSGREILASLASRAS